MKKRQKYILLILFSITLILVGCNRGDAPGSDKPVVYTSFYPIKNLVSSLAGDTLEVKSFMPENKEPHFWEPTPKDMKKLSEADLLVVNGANLEHWLDLVRDTLPELDILVLSDSVELITYKGAAALGDFQYMADFDAKKGESQRIEFGHTHEDLMRVCFINNSDNKTKEDLIKLGKEIMRDQGELVKQKDTINVVENKVYSIEMGHESGEVFYKLPSEGKWVIISDRVSEPILSYEFTDLKGNKREVNTLLEGSTSGMDKITYDPHSWLSIVNAKKYINSIQDELIKRYPENEREYRKNKLKIVDELSDIEFQFKEKFEKLKMKEFVVTHNAYAYLARDFGLKQFPLQGLISTETPSLKTIRKAIDFCNYYGIKTVFYEYRGQQKGADTVAAEIGGNSLPLASMEYGNVFNEKDLNGYANIMKMNLENLYKSMGGTE